MSAAGTATRTASQRTFDAFASFASSRAALALMFVWAFAEATVWPIIADFALIPLVAAGQRQRVPMLAAAIAGMALGGIATFALASIAPDTARDILDRLPLASDADIEEATRRLRNDGAWAFFAQPWSGVPYKVWGVQAGIMDMPAWKAIPAFIAARAFRMTIFALIAWAIGNGARPRLRDHAIAVALAYVAIFGLGLWLVSG